MEIFDKDEILNESKDIIDRARHVDALINSRGWGIFMDLVEREINTLKDIDKISGEIQLEGNKKAKKIIEKIIAELQSYIADGETQAHIIDKLTPNSETSGTAK